MIATLSLPPHRTRILEVPDPPPLFVLAVEAPSDSQDLAERASAGRFLASILHYVGTRGILDPWAFYRSRPIVQSRLLDSKAVCRDCGRSPDLLFSRDANVLSSLDPFAEFRCDKDLDE